MYFSWNIAVCFFVCFVISESLRVNNFTIKSGKTMDVPSALMKKVMVGSFIECACVCGAELDCTRGVFKSGGVECWLYSAKRNFNLNESTTDTVVVKCGRKEFRKVTGSDVSLYIPNSDLDTIDLHYVLFDVKTCERIFLDFYQQTTGAFGVYLGFDGGTKSHIFIPKVGMQSVNHDTPPYNCTSYKTFWITWNTTTIQFGTGNIVGTERLLHHNTMADIPTIDKMKIGSYYNGTTYWVFMNQGDRCD